MKTKILNITLLFGIVTSTIFAQVNESKTGAWYMYFWNTSFKDSQFGLQGDIQYRNWNAIGDLEQLLIRGGITYTPTNTNVKFTLGYGNITSGVFGEDNATKQESRIYQEVLLPQKIGERFYLKHRLRYEQRFVEEQDFRTRYRYNIFLTLPLNKKNLEKGAVYLSFYNEIFLNGQKDIGNNKTVEIFDINRLYGALGYAISDKLKAQIGYMQQTKNNLNKGQVQISIHHKF